MIEGVEQVQANLKRAVRQIESRAEDALFAEGRELEAASRERTPVDTGALRDSHHTSKPRRRGDSIEVVVSAGDSSTPYAVEVHEDQSKSYAQGEAKFLQKSQLASASGMLRELGSRLRLR